MFSNGLRLRAATGFGEYSYTGERNAQEQSFSAQTDFVDALVGYLDRLGPLTAKGFVGIAAIEHDVRPHDPQNPVQGRAYGPKAVVELWLNMGEGAWSSLDASWTSAHETYAGRVRTGYRLFDDVSVGIRGPSSTATRSTRMHAADCSSATLGTVARSRSPAVLRVASSRTRRICATPM